MYSFLKNTFKIISILFCLSQLQGCMDVITTGAGLAYDHHEIKMGYIDQHIKHKSEHDIQAHKYLAKNTNIDIYTYYREVLLTGTAKTPALRTEVINLVRKVPDVRYIINDIHTGPLHEPNHAINDSWISAKVNTKILFTGDLNPKAINITTIDGTVYVFATLYPKQGKELYNVIRDTYGVQRVVRIYNYIETPVAKG